MNGNPSLLDWLQMGGQETTYPYSATNLQSSSAYGFGGPRYNPNALGNQGFFIPSGAPSGQAPIGAYGTAGGTSPMGTMLTRYGQGFQTTPLAGTDFGGQDPRFFSQYAAPQALWQGQFEAMLNAAEQRRTAARQFVSERRLDQPETYTKGPLSAAATEAELLKREGESMARDIESDFARGGASLSSERNRAMEAARGATSMAVRRTRTLAEQEGMKGYQNMMARLLSIIGGGYGA